MKIEYAIIVKNKTRLELLIEKFNTKSQAQFYIESMGGSWHDYEHEHATFWKSLENLQKQLTPVLKNKIIDRAFLPSFIFAKNQLVIVIGQDGLLANTAKYAIGLPIVGVNPDPSRYDGILLPFIVENFLTAVKQVLQNDFLMQTNYLAEARLNDGQSLLAFNDLFIGASTHISARYKLNFANASENQSSSGIIVSTKAGSTGWLSSIFNMTAALSGGRKNSAPAGSTTSLRSNQLQFVVREPFKSKCSDCNVVTGLLSENEALTIESFMPSNGIIFSDGIESDFLHFNAGAIVKISLAKNTTKIVMPQ